MKRIFCNSLTALCVATALHSTLALSAETTSKSGGDASSGMPRDKGMNPQQLQQMQQSMTKMHNLMHQMQAAKSPEEHQKLEQQQMQLMQSHMQMMRSMMMPMMMQGASKPGDSTGSGMMGGQRMPMPDSGAPASK